MVCRISLPFSFEYVGLPFIMSFNTVSTATGNGWITLVTNMVSAFIVRIPLAYVLAFLCELGVSGIAIAIPIATAVGAIISIFILQSRNLGKNTFCYKRIYMPYLEKLSIIFLSGQYRYRMYLSQA